MNHNVSEIHMTYALQAVNELLGKGWVLLKIIDEKPNMFGLGPEFIVGKPRPHETWRVDGDSIRRVMPIDEAIITIKNHLACSSQPVEIWNDIRQDIEGDSYFLTQNTD